LICTTSEVSELKLVKALTALSTNAASVRDIFEENLNLKQYLTLEKDLLECPTAHFWVEQSHVL